MAIPNSTMPGHRQLHERAVVALHRCQELPEVEFKESHAWDVLKHHIARTAMAMANLRDGGMIIIGISERDARWSLTGLQSQHLSTFDPDDVIDFVNRFASPPVRVDLVTLDHDCSTFLVLDVHEFEHAPIICKRNSTENGRFFCAGDILIRPPGKPQTKKVSDAAEVDSLLSLAAEKRARRMLEMAGRLGLRAEDQAEARFDEELRGL